MNGITMPLRPPPVSVPHQARPVRRAGSPGAVGSGGGVTAAASACSTLRGPAREMCYAMRGGS